MICIVKVNDLDTVRLLIIFLVVMCGEIIEYEYIIIYYQQNKINVNLISKIQY